jgi:S1-C subfamily serine protease
VRTSPILRWLGVGRLSVAFVLLAALAAPSAEAGPLPSVVTAAREHGPALVQIHPLGRAEPSLGFMVGTRGIAVTVSEAREGEAVVIETAGGERHRARVLTRDRATGLTVIETLAPSEDAPWPTLVLATSKQDRVRDHQWLLGVSFDASGDAVAALGGLSQRGRARWLLDLPCPAGTPVLDARGRVVAIATASIGSHRVQAVPVKRLRTLLKELTDAPEAPATSTMDVTRTTAEPSL